MDVLPVGEVGRGADKGTPQEVQHRPGHHVICTPTLEYTQRGGEKE
jgi:hypothetical protein